MKDKQLNVTTTSDVVGDIEVYGHPDTWKLLCKASSKEQGWMKSTKVLSVGGGGCVVQVSTQQRNPDGSWSLAEALTYVPGAIFYNCSDKDPSRISVV